MKTVTVTYEIEVDSDVEDEEIENQIYENTYLGVGRGEMISIDIAEDFQGPVNFFPRLRAVKETVKGNGGEQ